MTDAAASTFGGRKSVDTMTPCQRRGKYLRDLRMKRSLSQRQLSRELGYSTPQFVSNWERGLSRPPYHDLGKLARIFRVQPRALVRAIIEAEKEKLDDLELKILEEMRA